jgi:hypothetical protein
MSDWSGIEERMRDYWIGIEERMRESAHRKVLDPPEGLIGEPDPGLWLREFLSLSEADQLDTVQTILATMKQTAKCYQEDHAGLRRMLEKTEVERDEAIRNGGGVGHPPQECGDPAFCPQHAAQYHQYQAYQMAETVTALQECVALQSRALQGRAHTAELGRAITRAENAEAEVRMLKSKVRFYESGK